MTSRGTDHPLAERIVVGVDGSPQSILALRWAARIAASTGAAIDAVIAWHLPVGFGWTFAPHNWHLDLDAENALTAAVKQAFAAEPPHLRLLAREGLPAKVLLDAAAGAQLLIVGSRGHGGFVGLLLGSVSAACAEHAPCPVLIVHDRPDDTPPAAG